MKLRRVFLMMTLVLGLGLVASVARADNVDLVTMNFASGATFTGTVTFANDYNSVTGVNGALTEYLYGTGFTGSASDTATIDWVWNLGINQALDNTTGLIPPNVFGTFLMDGDPNTFFNWIAFTYDYSSGLPAFVTDPNIFSGNGADVDFTTGQGDPLTSGSIVATPEPSSLLLLGVGLAALLKARSRKRVGSGGQLSLLT